MTQCEYKMVCEYEKTVYQIIPKTHIRWSIIFHSCHTSMITSAKKNKHHTAFPMLISFKPQVTLSYMQSEVNRLEMHVCQNFSVVSTILRFLQIPVISRLHCTYFILQSRMSVNYDKEFPTSMLRLHI